MPHPGEARNEPMHYRPRGPGVGQSTDDDGHESPSLPRPPKAHRLSPTGVENDDDEDEERHEVAMYNPEEFADLAVSSEVKDLFDWITHYKPHDIELGTVYKPFIPDYIPACGDIDCFIKVPRPDGKDDQLGLVVLDEPAGNQSDPTALDLQLRVKSKKTNLQPVTVRSIEAADKNPTKITAWISNIQKVQSQKPPASVTYSRPMPELDQLLEPLSESVAKYLETHPNAVPNPEIDLTVEDYAKVVCALLEIPVHDNIVQSLYLAFSLYNTIKKENSEGK